ncbi:MAG: PhzF family phenazine biosynthesis protein [Gemmatimonadetes bacterium]|nr:PhzF family phenazine biosynthesis protein [Gemmatimonadota bacterium]
MDLRFHTLDVFTDRTFGGNPLGVFPDAAHLSTALMQRVAREMNLSESVFLGPPESGGTARVRIFTPGVEVPFAGHPTVGTAIFLASRLDIAPADGATTLVLEENVGHVPVDVHFRTGLPLFARFTTALLPEHRPSPVPRPDLALMVGLNEDDLDPNLPVEMVSCGLPFHCIPLRSADAVRRAVLDMAAWKRLVADSWAHHVYLVSLDAEGANVDVRVRMFAPGSGVAEDPATGSAAAALGGYLSAVDGSESASLRWTVEQGLEIGRPSLLYVEAEREAGATAAVRVGGSAVLVSEGVMRVPR